MTKIFMIITLAILVLGIGIVIALVLLNKRKNSNDRPSIPVAPPVPRVANRSTDTNIDELLAPTSQPTTIAPAQRSVPTQQSTPVAMAPLVQPVDKVDTLIEQQQYNEATNELKRILMANPKNSAAMLKLLQVYGITNNFKAFNALHAQIHNLGDSEAIKEADFRRSLLEDEILASSTPMSMPQTVPAPQVSEPVITQAPEPSISLDEFALDFDSPSTSSPEVLAPQAQVTSTEEFSLDFDVAEPTLDTPASAPMSDSAFDDLDFNFDSSPTAPVTQPIIETPPVQAQTEENHDFSLDFDIGTPAEVPEQLTDELADLGLSFESETTAPPTPVVASTPIQEESFDDFSFDLPSNENTQKATSTPAELPITPTADTSDNGFDFNFDDSLNGVSTAATEAEHTPTPIIEPAVTAPITSNDGFDFDFGSDLTSSSAAESTPAPQIEPVIAETSNELDAFDLSNFEASATPDITQESFIDEPKVASSNEISFDELVIETPVITKTAAPVPETSPSDDFGFDLDLGSTTTQTPTPEPVTAVVQPTTTPEADFGLDLDIGMGAQPEPIIPESVVVATPIQTSLDATTRNTTVSEDLNFTTALDNAEITLNLANKYLGLGEQDSAKRLLQEVATLGNPSQQQTAKNLLARLG